MTAELINSTTLPDDAKMACLALINTLPHFEQRRKGRDFQKLLYAFLDMGYPEHLQSWSVIFGIDAQPDKPKPPKFHDTLQSPRKNRKNAFEVGTLNSDCPNCTQEELDRLKKQKELANNMKKEQLDKSSKSVSKSVSVPPSLDKAQSARDVLAFFDNAGSGVSPLVNMKSVARSLGIKIDKDEKNLEAIADKIWDELKLETSNK